MTIEAGPIPFERLLEADVKPGLMIVGFPTLESLDELVETLRDVITETHFSSEDRERMRRDESVFLHPASRSLWGAAPRTFTGRLQDLRVTILPPDTSFIRTKPENIIPDSAINFLAEIDMYFSGRGVIGSVGREFALYVRQRRSGPRVGAFPHIMMSVRKPKGEGLRQWERIAEQSQRTALEVWRRGLQRVMSGGLPGLGKRR